MQRIIEWVFDDQNVDKLGAHGVNLDELNQLLENVYTIARNRKSRAAGFIVRGITNGGRRLVVPADPIPGDTDAWRPITAWCPDE